MNLWDHEYEEDHLTYVHDLSPFVFQFPEGFLIDGIRWYGLAYLSGFATAYAIIMYLIRRGKSELNPNHLMDFITYAAFGTLIGGRLGYCLFYDPQLLIQFTSEIPFWGVLQVNKGGMASHGGIIGIGIACLIFTRRFKIRPLYLCDLCVVGGPIGVFYGRMANFINGELFGRPVESEVAWAVKFPQEMYNWVDWKTSAVVDTRLNELGPAVSNFGVSSEQWQSWVSTMGASAQSYNSVSAYMDRIIVAIQEGNTFVRDAMAPILTARHPSQLYAGVLEGLVVFGVLFMFWKKPRKPGVVGAFFLVVYAIVRIINEQFREPDAHIGYELFGLTRGQWLSIAMMIVGILMMVSFQKRDEPEMGGWGLGRKTDA